MTNMNGAPTIEEYNNHEVNTRETFSPENYLPATSVEQSEEKREVSHIEPNTPAESNTQSKDIALKTSSKALFVPSVGYSIVEKEAKTPQIEAIIQKGEGLPVVE